MTRYERFDTIANLPTFRSFAVSARKLQKQVLRRAEGTPAAKLAFSLIDEAICMLAGKAGSEEAADLPPSPFPKERLPSVFPFSALPAALKKKVPPPPPLQDLWALPIPPPPQESTPVVGQQWNTLAEAYVPKRNLVLVDLIGDMPLSYSLPESYANMGHDNPAEAGDDSEQGIVCGKCQIWSPTAMNPCFGCEVAEGAEVTGGSGSSGISHTEQSESEDVEEVEPDIAGNKLQRAMAFEDGLGAVPYTFPDSFFRSEVEGSGGTCEPSMPEQASKETYWNELVTSIQKPECTADFSSMLANTLVHDTSAASHLLLDSLIRCGASEEAGGPSKPMHEDPEYCALCKESIATEGRSSVLPDLCEPCTEELVEIHIDEECIHPIRDFCRMWVDSGPNVGITEILAKLGSDRSHHAQESQ